MKNEQKKYFPIILYVSEIKINVFSFSACLDENIKMILDNNMCKLFENYRSGYSKQLTVCNEL